MYDDQSLHEHIIKSIKENEEAIAAGTDYKSKYEDLLARVNAELSKRESNKVDLNPTKKSNSDDELNNNSADVSVLSELKKEAVSSLESLTSLQERWSYFDHTMQDCLYRLNRSDQYSRINSLIVKGFPPIPPKTYGRELKKKIVQGINDLLPNLNGGPVQLNEVEYGHTLKTRKSTSKHIVIVKFSCRFTRNEVFYSKRDLPKGVSISEHLTQFNLKLLNKAKDIVGVKNVWTSQTKIYAKLYAEDKNKLAITSWQGIDKLYDLVSSASRSTAAYPNNNSRMPYYVDRGPNTEHSTTQAESIQNSSNSTVTGAQLPSN